MIHGIEEVQEMVNQWMPAFTDFEDDETVYFSLIVAHAGLLKFASEGGFPSGLRSLILEVTGTLRNFLSQSALSSLDLVIIRDSFERILSWTEADFYFGSYEDEPEILNRKRFHVNKREENFHA